MLLRFRLPTNLLTLLIFRALLAASQQFQMSRLFRQVTLGFGRQACGEFLLSITLEKMDRG